MRLINTTHGNTASVENNSSRACTQTTCINQRTAIISHHCRMPISLIKALFSSPTLEILDAITVNHVNTDHDGSLPTSVLIPPACNSLPPSLQQLSAPFKRIL